MFYRLSILVISLAVFLSAVAGCGRSKEVSSQPTKDTNSKAKAIEGKRKLRADE